MFWEQLPDTEKSKVYQQFKNLWERISLEEKVKKSSIEGYDFEFGVCEESDIPKEHPYHSGAGIGIFLGTLKELNSQCRNTEEIKKAIDSKKFLIFVVSGQTPNIEFDELVALHEYEEIMHFGNHGIATMIEFEKAAQKGDNFLTKYTEWWVEKNNEILSHLDEENKEALSELMPDLSRKILEKRGFI